ncbi:MAG: hypothetical protein HXY20_11475 [Acidobacteria bacterium]|nr:hypothetical protein [Acidobacteriota bacterium]
MLRHQLDFVAKESRTIASIMGVDPERSLSLRLGAFEAVAAQDEGSPRLFVIRRHANRPEILGYQVDLDHLRGTLLERGGQIPASVGMEITIAPGNEISTPDDPTVLVQDLSPFTPWWRASIRPQDKEIISRYIARRRWIYGTTSALLAAGMFLGVALVLRDLSRGFDPAMTTASRQTAILTSARKH